MLKWWIPKGNLLDPSISYRKSYISYRRLSLIGSLVCPSEFLLFFPWEYIIFLRNVIVIGWTYFHTGSFLQEPGNTPHWHLGYRSEAAHVFCKGPESKYGSLRGLITAVNCPISPKTVTDITHMKAWGWVSIKPYSWGLPWWRRGWESPCQCRGHGFEPWSGKIPHATEQLGPWATTTEPARLEPGLRNKRGRDSERPAHRDEEWPPLTATRESPPTETKTQHSHK